MQIEELPGVEPRHVLGLREVGIRTSQQLLHVVRCSHRLPGLAQASGLSMEALRDLVDRAGLGQLQGIGPANLACLIAAGIPTLSALATQEPETLRLRLSRVTGHPPNLAVVEHWIGQARQRQKSKPGQEGSPAPDPSAG